MVRWLYWFCFFSVFGIWYFKFLPAFRHAEHVFAFPSMSLRMFGHQKIWASWHILLVPGWPKWSAFSAAYRRLLGITILSSTSSMPQRWVSFLATFLNSSGTLCRLSSSMQIWTSIRSGSALVSFISVSRSCMKSNSAVWTLSSWICCCFSTRFCLFRRSVPRFLMGGPSLYSWTGIPGYEPGSFIVGGSQWWYFRVLICIFGWTWW